VKVLHLTDDADSVGGVQTYLRTVAAQLPAEGVECEVWGADGTVSHFGSHLTRWASPRHERVLRAKLEVLRPDVVHAHNLWMRMSPLPLRGARAAGVPVVMTVHDYHLVCPRKWMITSLEEPCERGFGAHCLRLDCRGSHEGSVWMPYNAMRWIKVALHRRLLCRWVDRFVCPSEHLAGWLRRNLGTDNVVHIPNFARRSVISEDSSGVPNRLLFAGRLSREKGVGVLIEALAIMRERVPEVSLVIAGDGPERVTLEALAKLRGVDAAVRFVGPQQPHELDRLYAEAAVVVLPTLWMENCPVSVLEAMARARAVVATRIGGVPELVQDGVTGVLVERGDAGDLSEVLEELFENPDRLRVMGRAAAEAYHDRYTPESHVQRLAGLYRKLRN